MRNEPIPEPSPRTWRIAESAAEKIPYGAKSIADATLPGDAWPQGLEDLVRFFADANVEREVEQLTRQIGEMLPPKGQHLLGVLLERIEQNMLGAWLDAAFYLGRAVEHRACTEVEPTQWLDEKRSEQQ